MRLDRGVIHVVYGALQKVPSHLSLRMLKGQDHIVTTLKNQIKADRVGHAYLFCGTRGTGKTTVAKIFAKAVNCLSTRWTAVPAVNVRCARSISGRHIHERH